MVSAAVVVFMDFHMFYGLAALAWTSLTLLYALSKVPGRSLGLVTGFVLPSFCTYTFFDLVISFHQIFITFSYITNQS